MGIVVQEARFAGDVPSLDRIAVTVRELCRVPLVVRDASAATKGDLYALHAELAFAAASRDRITIFAYRPGAIPGAEDAGSEQVVHVRGHAGHEQTLFMTTALALEQLGATLGRPMSKYSRRRYGTALTPAILVRRIRLAQWRSIALAAGYVVALPVLGALAGTRYLSARRRAQSRTRLA